MPSVASGTEGISAYTQNGRDDLRVVRIAPELIKQRSARRPAPPCNAQEFSNAPGLRIPYGMQHFKALGRFKYRGFLVPTLKTGGTTSVSSALPLN